MKPMHLLIVTQTDPSGEVSTHLLYASTDRQQVEAERDLVAEDYRKADNFNLTSHLSIIMLEWEGDYELPIFPREDALVVKPNEAEYVGAGI